MEVEHALLKSMLASQLLAAEGSRKGIQAAQFAGWVGVTFCTCALRCALD